MKILKKEDVLLLVSNIKDRNEYNLEDFELMLEKFGDDYFIEDGRWTKVRENKLMRDVRREYGGT